MSDFLTNLVQRHVPAPKAPGNVRPRPRARFEPDSTAAPGTPAGRMSSEVDVQPPTSARLEPERMDMAPATASEGTGARPPRTLTRSQTRPPGSDTGTFPSLFGQPAALIPPERPSRYQSPADSGTLPAVMSNANASQTQVSPSATTQLERDKDLPGRQEARPPVEALKAAEESSPAAQPNFGPDQAAPVVPAASAAVRPAPVEPARSGHDTKGARTQDTTTSAGVVHVTIGRIEVKAQISQPGPPRRQEPKPASPIMSLDDYLQRRGRKERR